DMTWFSAATVSSGRVFDSNGQKLLAVQGGGDLSITAGGSIRGGEYLVSRGAGTLNAGGAVGSGDAVGLFLLGETSDAARRGARVTVQAVSGANIQNVSNPTILTQSTVRNGGSGFQNGRYNFLSYTDQSAVDILSLGGNVELGSSPRAKPSI